MKVALSGSKGFIGSALCSQLENQGHQVFPLVRRRDVGEDAITWLPEENYVDKQKLTRMDAVIHLAGEDIFGWWTEKKKKKIRDSRVNGTRLLSEALAQISPRPATLICASAVGIYGNRAFETLTELSTEGKGFLASVCQEWEAATEAADLAGIRVIHPRFGLVLDPHGGVLKKMIPFFKMGLGGTVGSGRQYISWISREDLVNALEFLLPSFNISGPVNLVAPQPVTHSEFSAALAEALHRPAKIRLPAPALRWIMGEMAEELLLSSQRAIPSRLVELGFRFQHSALDTALNALLRGYLVREENWAQAG